jgi:EAL domain-containing protein (putative c-di-GMP-specific phosphodiesterase class I)
MAASAAMNCSGVASQAPATNATHSDPPCIATPARVVTRDHAPGVDGTTAGACAWTSGTAALAKGGVPAGFSLAYQPVVRLPDSTPVAIEALARWTAPNGADIQPDAFVAAAEAAGLGAALDAMVLDLACTELESAGGDLVLHVNIGAARLGSPEFERQVRGTLDRCGLTPSQLVLEITETVPVVDLADAAAQIARLNEMGITVALDDFGAGYSSLTYLHALPVQIIKLDRGLAVGPEPARIETLYRSVIRLCDSLGIEVIAEGIESTAQADTVFAAGCRLAQGHLFGRAVPISDVQFHRPTVSVPQHSGD